MVKKRATWLIILFLGEMLTATAMQGYNGEIEKAAILALFLPLIISSGGNSGSQATTLVIRAMALGELTITRLVSCRRARNFSLGCRSAWFWGRSDFSGSRSGSICTSLTTASTALARCSHRWHRACRSGPVGHPRRGNASLLVASLRARPGNVVGAVRRHPGRCDRAGDLLQRRALHSSWHAVVTKYFPTIATVANFPEALPGVCLRRH